MNLDQAWKKYLDDVEDVRQMFLAEPILEKHPEFEASAITLLHQTVAFAYNLVMAPRQNHPVFQLQTYLDPYVYTGHLPCPDFTYRLGFFNGKRSWRIWGKRNTSHWSDIQVSPGWWGEPGYRVIGNHDLDKFQIDTDGSFEIIASPNPHPGNWIKLDPTSENNTLMVRQATYDWEREVMVEFNIEPADDHPAAPFYHDADEVVRRLDLAGRMMKHAVHIWTAPASRRLLRHCGENQFVVRRGDGDRGANPLAQYAQGVFEVAPDEALIIESAVPNAPYWSIHLGNWWWETLDYTRYKSSINGHQAVIDGDGRFRAVLCHADPGIPNWLDPVGNNPGLMLMRWYRADSVLEVQTRRVRLADLRRHLPADTPIVTRAEREQELSGRQRGTLRRYGF